MVVFIAVFVALTLMFVHMTLAVLLGDIICFFLLWIFRGKPSLAEMVSWIDEGTIGLLMGMMLVVGVFSATGLTARLCYHLIAILSHWVRFLRSGGGQCR